LRVVSSRSAAGPLLSAGGDRATACMICAANARAALRTAGNYNQVNKEDRGLNQNGAGEPVMGRGRAMAC